jgi:hypothetical protein
MFSLVRHRSIVTPRHVFPLNLIGAFRLRLPLRRLLTPTPREVTGVT